MIWLNAAGLPPDQSCLLSRPDGHGVSSAWGGYEGAAVAALPARGRHPLRGRLPVQGHCRSVKPPVALYSILKLDTPKLKNI